MLAHEMCANSCKRAAITTAALTVGMMALAAAWQAGMAEAKLLQMGQRTVMATPSCNDFLEDCVVVGKVTGFQVGTGAGGGSYVAKEDGRLISWGVTLGTPKKDDVTFFNSKFGADPKAQIAIIRKQKKPGHVYKLISKSEEAALETYYGSTPAISLAKPLKVKKGDVVALSIVSWAPLFQVNLSSNFSWRADRTSEKCDDATKGSVHKKVGARRQYACLFTTAQLLYHAEIKTKE